MKVTVELLVFFVAIVHQLAACVVVTLVQFRHVGTMSVLAGHDAREAQALFVVVAVVTFQSFRIGLQNIT